ncbi:hypothetical protein SBA3_1900001 [Candidatus Sulfopaludibacter sp. SbA3]|nr:hypothetical protein SBA3_1900001 [Candidatus Sulfopaludibacter sp. SbA3]
MKNGGVTPAVSPPHALSGRRQDRRRYPSLDRSFDPVNWRRTAPRNGMKNRRLVAPAVSPPVSLADRRQDRRRYPSLDRSFDPVGVPARGQRWV